MYGRILRGNRFSYGWLGRFKIMWVFMRKYQGQEISYSILCFCGILIAIAATITTVTFLIRVAFKIWGLP